MRIRLDNADGALRPDMYLNVAIETEPRADVLQIPLEAVIRTGQSERVILAEGDGHFRPASIVTGAESGGMVEILSGLAAGERIVVSSQFLLDSEASLAGIDIRPVDEALAAARSGEPPEQRGPETYRATGSIQSITARGVTLRHGPVPALEWPAMTMTFANNGPAQMRGFKSGDRVTFTFEQADSGPRLVSIAEASQ